MPAFLSRYRDQWMLALILGLLVVFFHVASGNFITGATFASVTNRIPTLTLVATGMTLVLIIGGIDLSVGSVLALSGAVLSTLVMGMGWPLWLGMLAALLVGALAGGVNGWITEKLRVPSFIVTLGTLEMARGLAYKVMNSETKYLGGKVDWLVQTLGNTLITPVLILAVVVVVLAQWILSRAVLGRKMIAIGTNETATSLAGIATLPVKVLVFVASGALAAVASWCQMARLGASDPNAGAGIELSAIAAAVIGGTSLSGGRGSVASTFIGVLIIATLEAGLAQMGSSEPIKRIVTGAVIVTAVLADTWRRRS